MVEVLLINAQQFANAIHVNECLPNSQSLTPRQDQVPQALHV